MVTNYILSIDPGVSTGIALIGYDEDDAPFLENAWQFTGIAALCEFAWDWAMTGGLSQAKNGKVIAEKFNARNTSGFSYTTDTLEPLRGEGVLIALGLMPDYTPREKRWRAPALQYLVGGKDLADKKKRQHAFLKDSGFYRTNKDFPDSPSKDGADDFRSAAAHGLNYLAREVKHEPTFELLKGWIDGR